MAAKKTGKPRRAGHVGHSRARTRGGKGQGKTQRSVKNPPIGGNPNEKGHPAGDLKPDLPPEPAVPATAVVLRSELGPPFGGSDANKARALVEFRIRATVRSACRAAGISRSTWYNWLEEDRVFAAAVQEAKDDVADELEEKAHQLATASIEPNGRLLEFLLKANRPGKYRENLRVELVSPVVRDKVRQTVDIVRGGLTKELADPLLKRLGEVWR